MICLIGMHEPEGEWIHIRQITSADVIYMYVYICMYVCTPEVTYVASFCNYVYNNNINTIHTGSNISLNSHNVEKLTS